MFGNFASQSFLQTFKPSAHGWLEKVNSTAPSSTNTPPSGPGAGAAAEAASGAGATSSSCPAQRGTSGLAASARGPANSPLALVAPAGCDRSPAPGEAPPGLLPAAGGWHESAHPSWEYEPAVQGVRWRWVGGDYSQRSAVACSGRGEGARAAGGRRRPWAAAAANCSPTPLACRPQLRLPCPPRLRLRPARPRCCKRRKGAGTGRALRAPKPATRAAAYTHLQQGGPSS